MTRAQQGSRKAWGITFLLFVAQIINYFDKSVIGLAATPIMQELGLTPEQYGLVASSFFSLYAVSGILVGFFLAGRVRSKTLLTILVVIWSMSQLPVIFFASLTTLIVSRVLLGIGEGPGNPTAISACHEWFSSENRNMPTALLMLGASVGSFVSAPLLSYVIVVYGWRSAFLVCSLLGICWLVLWLIFGEDGPEAVSNLKTSGTNESEKLTHADSTIPAKDLWLDSTIIASIIVGFCAYWCIGFTVAWLAPLVRNGLGYDAVSTGWIVAAIAGTNSIILLFVSFISQRLLKSGVSSRLARGGVNGASMILGGLALAAAASVDGPVVKLVLIAIGGALPTLTFTLGPAMVSEVAPLAQRSSMLIMIYAGITIAGFISPIVAGRLISTGGAAGYDHALIANAIIVIVGGIAGLLLFQPERTIVRFARLSSGTS